MSERVTAACLAANGHDVWGIDVDAGKVADIRDGRSPLGEPGLDDLVARTVSQRYLARDDVLRRGGRRGRHFPDLRRDSVDRRWCYGPVVYPPGRG